MIVSSDKKLSSTGVLAIESLAAGGLLVILQLIRLRPLGLGLGLVIAGAGLKSLWSDDPAAKKPGILLTAAGLLEFAFNLVRESWVEAAAGTLLGLGAFGFLGFGVWKGIQFLRGLHARA